MFTGSLLSLYLGPVLPQPAPAALLENLLQCTVSRTDSGRSGFQLQFRVGRDRATGSRGYEAILKQWLKIGTRVQITGTVSGRTHSLMDGIITNHQLQPSVEANGGTLTVTGEDLSVMLDLHEVKIPFPAMPDFAIAAILMAPLAAFGVVPMPIPTPSDVAPLPTDQVPNVDGTFMSALNSMAGTWGYVSYWFPGPARGQSFMYWGPPIRAGVPQKALTFGMGGDSNLKTVSFAEDGTKPKFVYGLVQESNSNVPVPVVGIPWSAPPLAPVPALVANLPFVGSKRLADDDGGNILRAYAKASAAFLEGYKDASTAQGELDTAAYGTVLSAHSLVELRGVGWTHDGLWYVKSVNHTISPGSWTQSFSLEREGTGAFSDRVQFA